MLTARVTPVSANLQASLVGVLSYTAKFASAQLLYLKHSDTLIMGSSIEYAICPSVRPSVCLSSASPS